MNPIRFHRFFIFLLSWAIAQEIPDIHPDNINSFPFNELKTGPEVKSSGKKLIQQPEGWTEISGVEKTSSDTIFVAVHGYGSTGYEWIYPLKKISERGFKTFFYRYDWDLCPDQVASQLAAAINELLFIVPEAKTMIILSHSFGGIITTLLANKLQISIPVEIHTIASPLAGYPGLTDRCEMSELSYPVFRGNMSHYQWRTQHKQDGAFRQLKVDPQLVAIDGSKVILLPEMMDGHRLGHNWSISWVIDHFGLNGDEDN